MIQHDGELFPVGFRTVRIAVPGRQAHLTAQHVVNKCLDLPGGIFDKGTILFLYR